MVRRVQKEHKELQAVQVSVPYLQWPDVVDEEFVTEDRLRLLFLRLFVFCEWQSYGSEVLVPCGVQTAVPLLLTGKSTELKKHFHLAQNLQCISTPGHVMFTALHPFLQ